MNKYQRHKEARDIINLAISNNFHPYLVHLGKLIFIANYEDYAMERENISNEDGRSPYIFITENTPSIGPQVGEITIDFYNRHKIIYKIYNNGSSFDLPNEITRDQVIEVLTRKQKGASKWNK